MRIKFYGVIVYLLMAFVFTVSASAAKFKPIVLDGKYDHDRFKTLVTGSAGEDNHVYKFRAYVSIFDGADDDDGDGTPDFLGIPHFVAYEIKRYQGRLKKGPDRPGTWITDMALRKLGLAPTDSTYKYSRAFRSNHSNWYVRGHLCMKQHAWRLGENADWNTHTVLNAVPQREIFNNGIWLDLEKLTAKWADEYGSVWVITGPVFEPQSNKPTDWLGEPEKGEMSIAIPDALFKIVVRNTDDPNRPAVLAFIYPQDVKGNSPYDHTPYMKSVEIIEQKTGLDFFTSLDDSIQKEIEQKITKVLWSH
ncbi:MAG: DNA/RNA non-specific endonuclease [Nitrospinae bacterium]|nr:DNA/RNA non-specific endonuclease [Nitrospinota bacterium]